MAEKGVKDLRAATVGSKSTFATEEVEWNGQTFEIRQPSVAVKSKIMSKCRIPMNTSGKEEDEEDEQFTTASLDYSEMQVWSVIYCTYDPDSGDQVFEKEDYENLRNRPSGSFVDEFSTIAMRLMNVTPEEDAKN